VGPILATNCFLLLCPLFPLTQLRLVTAVYDDTECGETLQGFEGYLNSTLIPQEKLEYIKIHELQLDCMWVIEVEEEWKVGPLKTNLNGFILVFKIKISTADRQAQRLRDEFSGGFR